MGYFLAKLYFFGGENSFKLIKAKNKKKAKKKLKKYIANPNYVSEGCIIETLE